MNFTVANNSATQPTYVFAHYGTLTGGPFTSFTGIPDGYTINYNFQNLKEIALVPLTTPLKLGDFNFDGHVNGADVTAMLTALTDLNKFEANNTLTPAPTDHRRLRWFRRREQRRPAGVADTAQKRRRLGRGRA